MLQIVTGHMKKRVQGAMLCQVSIHPIACIPHATVHTFLLAAAVCAKSKKISSMRFQTQPKSEDKIKT